MASSIPFLQLFELGPEIASGYPFVIRECTSKADRSKLIVKVYCKLGQTREDLFKFRAELDFWRLVKHSALTTSADMYDEEGFTYLLYPFPAGGNLATLIGDPSRSFTEGFARYIAAILLEATSFLHSNGIVHGAILPYNVVFGSDTSVPGWVHSAKLAFYLSQSRSSTTVFTDLQDIAYTTCSILRQKSGMFPRNIFHPKYLGAAWQHLSPLFLSFITDLWNAERDGRNIDYFIIHPWVRGVNSIETTNSGRLAKNRARSDDSGAAKVGRRASLSNADSMSFSSIYAVSTKPDSGLTPDPRATLDSYLSANTVVIKRYIYYKMRDRTKIGTHKWTRALGTLESHFLVLDTLLERDSKNPEQDQILPQVLDLTGKTAIVAAGSRHNYTLGVFDVEQQRVVVWLRFDENDDYLLWKQTIMDLSDPSKDHGGIVPASTAAQDTKGIKSSSSSSSLDVNKGPGDQMSPMVSAIRNVSSPSSRASSRVNGQTDPFWYHQAIVDAANTSSQLYIRQMNAQSTAYLRESKNAIGWRWTVGDKSKGFLSGWRLMDPNTTSGVDCVSLAPLPSVDRAQHHSAIKWNNRAQELSSVMDSGVPLNLPVAEGQMWFIVDATWFRHWLSFVTSSRRMAPPGAIDNTWMLDPDTDRPYVHLVEDDSGDGTRGDYRRVTPQVWGMFQQWYGGGPSISVTGPPVGDTRRWILLTSPVPTDGSVPSTSSGSSGSALDISGLVARLEDPSRVERRKGGAAVAIHTKGRRASAAEVAFVAAVSGFEDAEADVKSTNAAPAATATGNSSSQAKRAVSTEEVVGKGAGSGSAGGKSTLASLFGASTSSAATSTSNNNSTSGNSSSSASNVDAKPSATTAATTSIAIKTLAIRGEDISESDDDDADDNGGHDDFEPVVFIRDADLPPVRRASEPNAATNAGSIDTSNSAPIHATSGGGGSTSRSSESTSSAPSISKNNVFFVGAGRAASMNAIASMDANSDKSAEETKKTSTSGSASNNAPPIVSASASTSDGITMKAAASDDKNNTTTTATTSAAGTTASAATSGGALNRSTGAANTSSATTSSNPASNSGASTTSWGVMSAEDAFVARRQQRKSTGSADITGVAIDPTAMTNNPLASTGSTHAATTPGAGASEDKAGRRSSLLGGYFNKRRN